MWNKLHHKQKNIVLFAGVLLVLYICYLLSFEKTLMAIKQNGLLRQEQKMGNSTGGSYPQIKRESEFYNSVIKSYEVKHNDYESQVWQSLSGMASAEGVQITFNPTPQIEIDTLSAQKRLVSHQFIFKGDYFSLVKLLDTLGKSDRLGKVADMKLMLTNNADGKENLNKLTLQINIKGLLR